MEFTLEQEADIRASYRDAKNPQKQIDILADLYACKKEDILKVLGLKPAPKKKQTMRSYDQAVKNDAVKAVLLEGLTRREAAEKYGVPYGSLIKWVWYASKKQAEFLGYPEPKPEPESASVALFQPLPAADHLKVGAKLKELQSGLEGLCNFYDAFFGCTAICEDWSRIDNLILRAEGFLGGMEAAAQLMSNEKDV